MLVNASFNRLVLCSIFILTLKPAISQTRFIDKVFDSVIKQTFNYSKIQDSILKLDVYQPANDTLKKRPLLILVHGGGFYSGKRNSHGLISFAEKIAKKGYVVASVDYTLLYKIEDLNCDVSKNFKLNTIDRAIRDITKALLYLVNYKDDFKIDDTKIILYGSSAGAEIILNFVYNKQRVINTDYFPNIPKIAAVVSLSGAILDTSLIHTSNSVPGVFYHGTADPIVPYGLGSHHSCLKKDNGYLPEYGSKLIVDKLEKLNTSFLFYSYLNRKHDIFNLPEADFHAAFIFIKRVVFDGDFYQAKINTISNFK